MAQKLLKNLGRMQDMSSIINCRMQQHEEELILKQKQEEEKKSEKHKTLEMKMSLITSLHSTLKSE